MSFEDLFIAKAEILFESYGQLVAGAAITAIGFFASRLYKRIDSDRDELIRLREFVGQQKRENARLWEVIEELRNNSN